MPNNRKVTLKKVNGKDGVHPGSRKAGQITRAHLRSAKLASQGKVRKDENKSKLYRPNFFLRVVTSPEPLTLKQLRALITDAYIARNDERIAELTAERRPGRPKDKDLINLEELKRSELQEWATGFEVPDLTDPRCTRLMHRWVEDKVRLDSSYVDMLPYVRLAKDTPEVVVMSKPGRLDDMGLGDEPAADATDVKMD